VLESQLAAAVHPKAMYAVKNEVTKRWRRSKYRKTDRQTDDRRQKERQQL